jgi:HEAT repeat protein
VDIKQILELLGEHVPGEDTASEPLQDAVAGFAADPAAAAKSIKLLQLSDPPAFILAAVRLLTSAEEESPGAQYLEALILAGDVLIEVLPDSRILPEDAAIALARLLVAEKPLLDVLLMNQLLTNAVGGAVKAEAALRALALVEAVSDCSRLSSQLVQLMRHPSPQVRSKAALLLGSANLNLARVKSFLASDDVRLRANAVESLWGQTDRRVIGVLWEAAKDPHGRVGINALVGLCRAGESGAYERLKKLACSSNAVVRAGAAWAMGEVADPAFADPLNELLQDSEDRVRIMAGKSLQRLPAAVEPVA